MTAATARCVAAVTIAGIGPARASRRYFAVRRLRCGLSPGLVPRCTPAVVEVHQRAAARVPNSCG
jgi:hypothetical protein